jgi:hypothetical protein
MADFVSIDDEGNPHIDLSGMKRRQRAAVRAVEGSLVEEGRVVGALKILMHAKLESLTSWRNCTQVSRGARLTRRRWRADPDGELGRAQDRQSSASSPISRCSRRRPKPLNAYMVLDVSTAYSRQRWGILSPYFMHVYQYIRS